MKKVLSVIFIFILLLLVTACGSSDSSSSASTEDTTVPVFISSSTVSVYENQLSAITLLATDTNPVTYSISGTDAASFRVESSTGVVTFINYPVFETKSSYIFIAAASDGTNISYQNVTITILNESAVLNIPSLVVLMNWDDYSQTDPLIWSDKIFNPSANSINKWYEESINTKIQLTPVLESSGTANDGVIIVNMGKNHPGGYNDTTFRDTEISNAITSSEVADSMDFAALDTDGDGTLSRKELQIIFIVAGGEMSFGDPTDHSIWAHSWSFDSQSTLSVDGVYVMRYTSSETTAGGYARFGANHGNHIATVGIIIHEIGHSLLDLGDYYDLSGGSGLGWYDIMSGGSWAYQSSDSYAGETPTQFSAYNRIDSKIGMNPIEVRSSQDLTIRCSSNEFVKLVTDKTNEYFLLECRDTAKANSDISFAIADARFTEDRLFVNLYHVDADKTDNSESGTQTSTNHYKVALVEKDISPLMTSTERIDADYNDVYTAGDLITTTQTRLYDLTLTGYSIEILSEDYTNRTMTVRITK